MGDAEDAAVERLKAGLGFGVVVVAAGLVAFIVWYAMTKYATASDAAAVIGSAVGVVGTVVAAYFGISTAASGKAAAEKQRNDIRDLAVNVLAHRPAARASATTADFEKALDALETRVHSKL